MSDFFTDESDSETSTLSLILWTGHSHPGVRFSYSLGVAVLMSMPVDGQGNTLNPASLLNSVYRAVLLHEVGHELGAPDHYCYEHISGKDEFGNCYNSTCWTCALKLQVQPICVMTGNITDIEKTSIETLFCNSCKNTIAAHIQSHH